MATNEFYAKRLDEVGVADHGLLPEDAEAPDGFFLSRAFTAIGMNLKTKAEYGLMMSSTHRLEGNELEWTVGELKKALSHYEKQHDIEEFRREIFYQEELVPIPENVEELV